MIIWNIVHVNEFSTFTRRHNIVSLFKEISVKKLQTMVESVEEWVVIMHTLCPRFPGFYHLYVISIINLQFYQQTKVDTVKLR